MKTYRNPLRGFTLFLPNGWREPSLFQRLLSFGKYRHQQEQPEFLGPFNSRLKFSIHSIYPVPEISEQQGNLQRLAESYGNRVIYLGRIRVNGRDHATIIFQAPGLSETKLYSLIFGSTEYLITAKGRYEEIDSIVKSFHP